MRDSKGRFIKGFDETRHKFTREECQTGFWNALESIVVRHPDAIDKNGKHIACRFLKKGKRNETACTYRNAK